jgi:tRNA_anti-like
MTKKLKILIIVGIAGVLVASATAAYMYNMPHRNVQKAKIDYSLTATQIVNEYLTNATSANEKYLQEEGESKILAVKGEVKSINIDQNEQYVVLLKAPTDDAGVSCTFTSATNENAKNLSIGQKVSIKGVIRSGAAYDEDLEMFENVILEKCDILNNQ